MLFFFPTPNIFWIYILAALLPAAFLLHYIYKKDTIEKEPPALLGKLLLGGVLSAFAASVLENIGENLLNIYVEPDTSLYAVLTAFLVVAVAEEGAKFFFLRKYSWNQPAFNYMFDGIVYAVFVSLGFAAFENVLYVFNYGLGVAVTRAFLAIPGHMGFSVYMGIFYGKAKLCERWGDTAGRTRNWVISCLIAVLLHGFYDACLMVGTNQTILCFVIFVVLMYVFTWRSIQKASKEDQPI